MNLPVSPSEEAWLRSRFAEPRTVSPIAAGDGHLWRGPEEIRPAAVLVPVVRREGGLTVLLTRRTAHLNDHPVVGLVTPPLDLRPDDFEVAEVFEVPLAFLLDPANHQRHRVLTEGRERCYYAMPYRQYYIWGATAGMLMNFYAFLTG